MILSSAGVPLVRNAPVIKLSLFHRAAQSTAASTIIESLNSAHVFHNLSTPFIYTVLNQSHPLNTRELIVPGQPALKLLVGLVVLLMYSPLSHIHASEGQAYIVKVTIQVWVTQSPLLTNTVHPFGGVAS
jgi:hypothetical protein